MALLALLAYVFTGAVVPAGHMAAALDSGTPFHLCPGDLRSAQILAAVDATTDTAAGAGADHHSAHGDGHHAGHAMETDAPGTVSIEKSSADAGCSFAAGATVALAGGAVEFDAELALVGLATSRQAFTPRRVAWLRPPVRSPPA